MSQDQDLEDLLTLHDDEFVDAAYAVLLGRAPDAAGREAHLKRLRRGAARELVLLALADSPEGRQRGVQWPELEEIRRRMLPPPPGLARNLALRLRRLAGDEGSGWVGAENRLGAQLRTSLRASQQLAGAVAAATGAVSSIDDRVASIDRHLGELGAQTQGITTVLQTLVLRLSAIEQAMELLRQRADQIGGQSERIEQGLQDLRQALDQLAVGQQLATVTAASAQEGFGPAHATQHDAAAVKRVRSMFTQVPDPGAAG